MIEARGVITFGERQVMTERGTENGGEGTSLQRWVHFVKMY